MPTYNDYNEVRRSTYKDLNNIADRISNLESEYMAEKPGEKSLLNMYGMFSSNIANPKRVESIQDINRVINVLDTQLNSSYGTGIFRIGQRPKLEAIPAQVNALQTALNTLKGAVVNEIDSIGWGKSWLLSQLKTIIDYDNMTTEAKGEAQAAYQEFLQANPKIDDTANASTALSY